MKKLFLLGCLLLTASCMSPAGSQSATPAPGPTVLSTPTRVTPSPVPATATETIPPSPTFTPEPPPRFFTEEFEETPVYWSTLYASGDASRVETHRQDSKLVFELYNANAWVYAIYGGQEYETVHVEARIESTGSETNYMGLVCNYQEQDGWVEFNISSDGSYTILYGKWLGEGVAGYTPVADGISEYIHRGNGANEIGLDCLADKLQLYINGKLFRNIDISRFELSGGKVGLAVASFEEAPVIVAFDWVRVNEP